MPAPPAPGQRAHLPVLFLACLIVTSLIASTASAVRPTPPAASGPVQEAVQTHLGLFLTVPERREGFERIALKGERLEIWFMQPIKGPRQAEVLCDGVRWLVMGRLQQSGGVAGLFQALRMVNEVSLVFYDVKTAVDPDREGQYVQKRSPVPHARFTISRERAALLDPKNLDKTLRGRTCKRVGQSLLDVYWVRPS